MKYVFLWFSSFVVLLVVLGSVNCVSYYHLLKHGVRASGIVAGVPLRQHGSIDYTYGENNAYAGRARPRGPNPRQSMYKKGDSVVVYYSSVNPRLSMLGDPAPALMGELFSIIISAAIASFFIIYLLKRKLD